MVFPTFCTASATKLWGAAGWAKTAAFTRDDLAAAAAAIVGDNSVAAASSGSAQADEGRVRLMDRAIAVTIAKARRDKSILSCRATVLGKYQFITFCTMKWFKDIGFA
jgi:hypothetical protein